MKGVVYITVRSPEQIIYTALILINWIETSPRQEEIKRNYDLGV